MKLAAWLLFFLLTPAGSLFGGEVDVVKVVVQPDGSGTYRLDVTLVHNDTGWDHYADRWEILDSKGKVLATRVLMHPHVNEQPFTRSLSGVVFPGDIHELTVRGHDSVHGYGGQEITEKLSR